MSTRPPKPSTYHSWSREEKRWLTQGEVSWRRDRLLEANPSEYFDIEGGLDSPPLLKGTLGPVIGLNAVQARSGRPMLQKAAGRGSEWEELISDTDRNVDARRAPSGTYMHYAQLITAQEYEKNRLGWCRGASKQRLAWALHSQGYSERYISDLCEVSRRVIRSHIAMLDEMVHLAIDMDDRV